VYPSVHFLNRQAAREKLAAKRALTETARERHLALAEHYEKRAEAWERAPEPKPAVWPPGSESKGSAPVP
jgi:hypothetical protein